MLQAQKRLDDFEIIRLLGKGGMGEVYEARQTNPDRPVAIKVLAPWLANDDDALQRFWREAKVPANLDHPGIVRIISAGKTADGLAYYAMHLVRGITLAELIRQAKDTKAIEQIQSTPAGATRTDNGASAPLPTDPLPGPADAGGTELPRSELPTVDVTAPLASANAAAAATPAANTTTPMLQDYVEDRYQALARIGAQAARALAFAHQEGHLHRDIKPSNLMVDQHKHVYLVDFGLTRALDPEGNGTQPGIVPGTPWYMSPEQVQGASLDARSDLYSLGVTLFELATKGAGPYSASRHDKQAILTQVRSSLFTPLRTLAPDIPPALEQIILKSMMPRPEDRYATAAALAEDLENWCESAAGPAASFQNRAPAPDRRRYWPAVLIGAALTAALVLISLAVVNRMRPDPEVKLDGSKAWPEELRTARPETPVALLKNTFEPVWKEKLTGTGYSMRMGKQMQIAAPKEERCTMFALADADRAAFEFSAELCFLEKARTPNELGIFFGWRRIPPDPDGHHRYFILKLDETPMPKFPNGRLIVGTGHVHDAREGRPEGGNWFIPLGDEDASIPLPSPHDWHNINVKVRPDGFTVKVGAVTTRDFPLAKTLQHDINGVDHTDGAVGVWVSRGHGWFRRAFVTLPG